MKTERVSFGLYLLSTSSLQWSLEGVRVRAVVIMRCQVTGSNQAAMNLHDAKWRVWLEEHSNGSVSIRDVRAM